MINIITKNQFTKNHHSSEKNQYFFRTFILLPFFALSISACDKAEQKLEEKNVEAPRIEYKQLIVENDDSVDNVFKMRSFESGYSIDYQTRAGTINVLEYVLEYPDSSGYVKIEKAYKFGDKYIIVVSTGENGNSCPATTYAIGIDSKSEEVTGKEGIDGCSENIETFSDGNKLIVKKEGATSTFINGEVRQPPLTPTNPNAQKVEKGNSSESKVTVILLSDVEWLPEGSGVLLTTDKGYINGYSQSMMNIVGDGKKGECYKIKSESSKAITIHKNKYPNLDSQKNETEDLIAERATCN